MKTFIISLLFSALLGACDARYYDYSVTGCTGSSILDKDKEHMYIRYSDESTIYLGYLYTLYNNSGSLQKLDYIKQKASISDGNLTLFHVRTNSDKPVFFYSKPQNIRSDLIIEANDSIRLVFIYKFESSESDISEILMDTISTELDSEELKFRCTAVADR